MTQRKSPLAGFPNASELTRWGLEAKRTFTLITRASNKARTQWIHLGGIAWDVKQSAPRNSGILKRWREQYLPGVSDVVLSDAMWCHRNSKAVAMVREKITDPTNIRQQWRVQKSELVAAFLHQRRNDPEELAKEIGVSVFEADAILKQASRARTPTKRVPDDKIDELFEPEGHERKEDAPVVNTAGRGIAPDPYSTVATAIDQIEAGNVDLGLATLRDLLRRAGRR